MHLDTQTLLFVMWLNVTMMSVALWAGVERSTRSGLGAWNLALLIQTVSWVLFIVGMRPPSLILLVISVGLLCASMSAMYVTVKHFLHQPVSRLYVWGVPPLAALTHAMVFNDFAIRVAHINLILCGQMLWLAWLLLRPSKMPSGCRWRWLGGLAFMLSGLFVLGRAVLVIVSPESYPHFEDSHWINVLGLLVNNTSLTMGTLAFLLAHRDEAEQELKRMALTDALTGLHNRRWLEERGADHLRLAQRYHQPLSVLMLDLDFFKQINDTRGHLVGDRVLQSFAQVLREVGRDADLIARYGGEEFCILLPMSSADAAIELDERLRAAALEYLPADLGFEVTYSAGVAHLTPDMQTLSDLFAKADTALYEAKNTGRNRTVTA